MATGEDFSDEDDDEFLSQDEDASMKGDNLESAQLVGTAAAGPPAETLHTRAARHLREGRWEHAVRDFSALLKALPEHGAECELLMGRSAALCGLSRHLRAIPAAESECRALFAPDPTNLAASALRDAEAAVRLDAAHISDLHAARGAALVLLERYSDAAEAYCLARQHAPGSLLLAERQAECELAKGPGAATAAAAVVASPPDAGAARPACNFAALRAQALQDAECILCLKLLYEPVTTPCGHTFCRLCFARAADHTNKCPMCRTVVHVGRELPVSIVLKNLLERSFPEDYAARQQEEAAAASAAAESAPLPLFVMNVLMPGERMALNIFEPRYRLMVRRVMEGSRRFGMAAVDRSHQLCDVACESEITECEPLPDGRFYIEVVGRRRFRPRQTAEQDGYRVAAPEFLTDDAVEPGSPAEVALQSAAAEVGVLANNWVERLRSLGQSRQAAAELLRRVGERPPSAEHEKVSFWVANLICPVMDERSVKLQMLRTTSTLERMQLLRQVLMQLQDVQMSGCTVM